MVDADSHLFQAADYAMFAITILVSVGIGVYHALSGGKQKTTSEFLLAGRQMSFLPVAVSLFVSYESSIMMLGLPAETYFYGTMLFVGSVTACMAQILMAWVTVPLLYPLKVTSVYQYLELRFKSRSVRTLASFLGIMYEVWYMGVVLFGPAVALQAVTGFPMWVSIVGLAAIAVIYTAIGGLKAVIWTDVFQAIIVFSGIFAVLVKGTIDVGGAKAVWDTAKHGGRLNFFDFDLDPRTRHTFWNLSITFFFRLTTTAFRQSTFQRISSTSSMRDAKRVMLITAPFTFGVSVLALYEGVVAYAYFATKDCDPFANKQLKNPNQIIPFIVMDIFRSFPGMPGLFVAALFSASLSTLSSCLSSSSSLILSDIVRPLVGNIPEWKATLIAKLSVVVFGVVACCIAFLTSLIGGTLQQIFGTLLAAILGPQTGIFCLGAFCHRSNAKGTIMGAVLSFVIVTWIAYGMSFSPAVPKTPYLPLASTEQCDTEVLAVNGSSMSWMNQTGQSYTFRLNSNTTTETHPIASEERRPHGIEHMYTISYTWLSAISITSTIFFGYIFSLLSGANKPGDVDPRYLLAVSDSLLIFLPKRIRRAISSMGTQFISGQGQLIGESVNNQDNGIFLESYITATTKIASTTSETKLAAGECHEGQPLDDSRTTTSPLNHPPNML